MSVVNFGEVYYTLLKLAGERATGEYVKTLQHSMTMIDADQAATIAAATLKHETRSDMRTALPPRLL